LKEQLLCELQAEIERDNCLAITAAERTSQTNVLNRRVRAGRKLT